MSNIEFRVALVGAGGIARRYRRTYKSIDHTRVIAAIDVNLEEAKVAASELGASRASTEFAEALAPDIDAVVISTPNHLHCDQAIAALRAGKHVLLQKPMSRTAEECDRILAAQRESGRALGVYMNLLDHPLFRDWKDLIQAGLLGEVALYSARLAHRGGLTWGGVGSNWRASRDVTGGGSLIQLAVHYEHLMCWLLGTRVTHVQAVAKNIACKHLEGDDLALTTLELESGALGDIQTSWCVQEEHVSVMGTKGSIHYRDNRRVEFVGECGPFNGRVLHLKGDGTPEVIDGCLAPAWDDSTNVYNQHRRFFEALANGKQPEVTGEDAREDVRVIEACYQAAQEGRTIDL